MATLNLARLQFQKEFTTAGVGSGANTYVLDAISNGILLKVEANGTSGTVVLKVRWFSTETSINTIVQTLTFTCISDTTGVSQAGYNHTTFPSVLSGCTGLASLDGFGLHSCKIDIVSIGAPATAASVWIAGK